MDDDIPGRDTVDMARVFKAIKVTQQMEHEREPERTHADRAVDVFKGIQTQGGIGAAFGVISIVMLSAVGWKLINDMSDAMSELAANQRGLMHQNERLVDEVQRLNQEIRDSQRMRMFGPQYRANPYQPQRQQPYQPNQQQGVPDGR